MSKNTIIDGIAASEHLDSSGESLSIEGMDISSLGSADSILNWEHGSKDRPSQVVGKVTFARKIMKKDDTKTDRERYFWNKVKKPFVYIKAELFDGLGHSGAQDVAAMLRYKNKDKGEESRLVVGFSIEGGKIEKKGMIVTKSIARDVAITVKPCNKVCDAEIIKDNNSDDFLYKNEFFDCEILEKSSDFKINSTRLAILKNLKKDNKEKTPQPMGDAEELDRTRDVERILKNYDTDNKMRKALIAGSFNVAPSSLTGMPALSTEEIVSSKKKVKKNQPDLSFSKLGHENISRQNVKQIDDPFAALQAYKTTETPRKIDEISEKIRSQNPEDPDAMQGPLQTRIPKSRLDNKDVSGIKGFANKDIKQKTSKSFAFPPAKSAEAVPGAVDEKGRPKYRGGFDTTAQHESLHDHLNQIEMKAPGRKKDYKKDLRHSLVRHSLSHFSPSTVNAVKTYLTQEGFDYAKISPQRLNEEILTHLSDFRSNPKKRASIYKAHNIENDEIKQRTLQNSIKEGWKKLMDPGNPAGPKNLTWDKLREIHKNYKKQDKQTPKVQKIPSGVSGIKE